MKNTGNNADYTELVDVDNAVNTADGTFVDFRFPFGNHTMAVTSVNDVIVEELFSLYEHEHLIEPMYYTHVKVWSMSDIFTNYSMRVEDKYFKQFKEKAENLASKSFKKRVQLACKDSKSTSSACYTFSANGILFIVYDYGEEIGSNKYQFIHIPYYEFKSTWFTKRTREVIYGYGKSFFDDING